MCLIVLINRGEVEIETPNQFEKHFNFKLTEWDHNEVPNKDLCLCSVDVEGALKSKGIAYKTDAGDIYVGELEHVIGDNDQPSLYTE